MSRNKLIVVLATTIACMAVISIALFWWLDPKIECWDDSYPSPVSLLGQSDFVALCTLVQYQDVGEVAYLQFGDTVKQKLVNLEFVCISPAKGQFDSLSVWTLDPKTRKQEYYQIGSEALVYGRMISTPDSITLIALYGTGSRFYPAVASSLLGSPNIMRDLATQLQKAPVLTFTDGGKVFDCYHDRMSLCYYDEKGKAHSVSPQVYWKQILAALQNQN
jgi:hypothetical protein